MFLGEYQHTIDDKGRLTLPAKFREALSDGLVITKGFEGCLLIFTRAEWPGIEERISSLQLLKKDARKLSRFFFAGAGEELPDKQGRVLVPKELRAHAGLNKDVIVIGVSRRIEVWDKDRWRKYAAEAEESYEQVAEELSDIGL